MINFKIKKDIEGTPYLFIDEKEIYWVLCELNSCDAKHIIEIVDNLEKVMAGELEEFEFGYDATIIDFRKEMSIINYNYFEDQLEVSSWDIYNLMKEWKEHIIRKNKD